MLKTQYICVDLYIVWKLSKFQQIVYLAICPLDIHTGNIHKLRPGGRGRREGGGEEKGSGEGGGEGRRNERLLYQFINTLRSCALLVLIQKT